MVAAARRGLRHRAVGASRPAQPRRLRPDRPGRLDRQGRALGLQPRLLPGAGGPGQTIPARAVRRPLPRPLARRADRRLRRLFAAHCRPLFVASRRRAKVRRQRWNCTWTASSLGRLPPVQIPYGPEDSGTTACRLIVGRLKQRSLPPEMSEIRPFEGRLDELALYDRPLTPEEISRHARYRIGEVTP